MFTWTLPGQTWRQTRVESRTQSHFWQNMVKKKSSWNNKKHQLIYLYMQSAICSVSTSVIFRKSDTVNATEWFRCWWGYWKSYILNPFFVCATQWWNMSARMQSICSRFLFWEHFCNIRVTIGFIDWQLFHHPSSKGESPTSVQTV